MMEDVFENESYGAKTTTNLSEVVGPGLLTEDRMDSPPRLDDQGPGDTFTWSSRLIDLTALKFGGVNGVPFGPADATKHIYFNVLDTMKSWPMHSSVKDRYYGFSYDSIKFRVTLSNPKNLVGACVAGWFPYVDYFDESPLGTFDTWVGNREMQTTLINSTDSQLMLYGSAQDVQVTVPWSFKFPMFTTQWQRELNESSQDGRPPHGAPIFYVTQIGYGPSAVSELASTAYLRVYAEFVGLKYFGPQDMYVAQSGVEAVLPAAALGAAAETGLSYLTDQIISAAGGDDFSSAKPGNFDNPQAVQMSYFGDTTSVDYPQTRPIFKDGLPSPANTPDESIASYISKPFLAEVFKNEDSYSFLYLDPTGISGNKMSACNYLNYFAMMSRYWRGGMELTFVIPSHPLVETELTVCVDYDSTLPVTALSFDNRATHRSVRSGSYSVCVPIPFLNVSDYRPVFDYFERPERAVLPPIARIAYRLRVIGTMLDIEPDIQILVFANASKDFCFYQPYPPGLYNVSEFVPIPREAKEKIKERVSLKGKRFIAQVGLPFGDETERADMRAVSLPDPGILVPIRKMSDFMKIWSRAVPFSDYTTGPGAREPIADASIGFNSPVWFPPIDWARDVESDNSWYFTNDYVAMISCLYLYWRGTMGYKIIASSTRDVADYMFVSLTGINRNEYRAKTHSPFGESINNLPADSNFGTGCVATPVALQPVLEVSIPYRGSNVWGNVIWTSYTRGVARVGDLPPSGVVTGIQLVDDNNLYDTMFRKIDDDFALCVPSTLPPPTLWLKRGFSIGGE